MQGRQTRQNSRGGGGVSSNTTSHMPCIYSKNLNHWAYGMLCMLCYAMLCYAMLCYAMLCYAMLCYAMLWYGMVWYGTLGTVENSKRKAPRRGKRKAPPRG